MDFEFNVMRSNNVQKPTIFFVLPPETEQNNEIIEEIESYLDQQNNKKETGQKNILTEFFSLGEFIRYHVGDKKVLGIDVSYDYMNGNIDENEIFTFDGEEDWFQYMGKLVNNYSEIKEINHPEFQMAIREYTLFSSLLGAAVYIGGHIKTIGSTMVGIYYNKRGMCWITYPSNDMKVYLRKGMYDEVDNNKVIYSEQMDGLEFDKVSKKQLKSSTFGDYPYYWVKDIQYDEVDDPDFILSLIMHAKKLNENKV